MTAPPKPPLHPACALWPKMSESELDELAGDIKLNGQLDDIALTPDGKLLEGSNRWDACAKAGVLPRTIIYQGNDPIGFVISKNKLRRHMTKTQLSIIGDGLTSLEIGRPEKSASPRRTFPQKHVIAEQIGVSVANIQRARRVRQNAVPNLMTMVEQNLVSLDAAADAIRQEPDKERQAKWTVQDVKQVAKEKRASRKKVKTTTPRQESQSASVPDHIHIRQHATNGSESQVRETSAKGFFLVNLYLTKKEVTFLNRALNKESSHNEYEMAARCLIKSLRERSYELTNLNRIQ